MGICINCIGVKQPSHQSYRFFFRLAKQQSFIFAKKAVEPRIACLAAPQATKPAIAPRCTKERRFGIQQNDRYPVLCQVIGCRNPGETGPNNGHIAALIGTKCLKFATWRCDIPKAVLNRCTRVGNIFKNTLHAMNPCAEVYWCFFQTRFKVVSTNEQ